MTEHEDAQREQAEVFDARYGMFDDYWTTCRHCGTDTWVSRICDECWEKEAQSALVHF